MTIYILATTDGDCGHYIQDVFDSREKARAAQKLMLNNQRPYSVILEFIVK